MIMKKDPKISLNMVSSTGRWLRDTLAPQHSYVSLTIEDTEGRIIVRAALTMDQFTHMLISNMETTCTLERYRDENGKLAEDIVNPPPTVEEKMKDRMKEYRENLGTRMNDIYKDLYEMMNSGVKPGKKKLEELLREVDTVRSHFKENENFVIKQAQEELSQMQENMRVQLSSYMKTLGADIKPDEIKFFGDTNAPKLLTEGSVIKPVLEPYQKKERDERKIKDMTSRELADCINLQLRRLENTQSKATQSKDGYQILHYAGCVASGNKGVTARYISYQGNHFLTNEEAKKYLTFLRTVENITKFKTHWGVLNEKDGTNKL
jgi:hypothetical protein